MDNPTMTVEEVRELIKDGYMAGPPQSCIIDGCGRPIRFRIQPYPKGSVPDFDQWLEEFNAAPALPLCALHYDAICGDSVTAEADLIASDEQRKAKLRQRLEREDNDLPF